MTLPLKLPCLRLAYLDIRVFGLECVFEYDGREALDADVVDGGIEHGAQAENVRWIVFGFQATEHRLGFVADVGIGVLPAFEERGNIHRQGAKKDTHEIRLTLLEDQVTSTTDVSEHRIPWIE